MRRWARLVIVANIVFVLAWLVAAVWQGPHYNIVAHSISDMYANHAPNAWFLLLVLTLCGAATLLYAFGSLWPALREAGWTGKVGVILLALSPFGFGDLLSVAERENCRLADPGCTANLQFANFGGLADDTLTTVGSWGLIVSGILLAIAMRRLPEWRSRWLPTVLVTVLIVVLIGIDGAAVPAGYGGLAERAYAFVGAAWITVLAVWTLQRSRTPATAAV
jgi:hypothetical membrane protein